MPATIAFRSARFVRPYQLKYIFLIFLLYRSNIYFRHDIWSCPPKFPILCSHSLLTSYLDISKFLIRVVLMYPTFWKFMRNYNNDNIVKFLFKFISIFHTPEKIDYYIAALHRQLLQHMCQALHILVSRTNQVLHFLTSTHWRVSKLLPKKPKQNGVLCNNKQEMETVEETASIFRDKQSFLSWSW